MEGVRTSVASATVAGGSASTELSGGGGSGSGSLAGRGVSTHPHGGGGSGGVVIDVHGGSTPMEGTPRLVDDPHAIDILRTGTGGGGGTPCEAPRWEASGTGVVSTAQQVGGDPRLFPLLHVMQPGSVDGMSMRGTATGKSVGELLGGGSSGSGQSWPLEGCGGSVTRPPSGPPTLAGSAVSSSGVVRSMTAGSGRTSPAASACGALSVAGGCGGGGGGGGRNSGQCRWRRWWWRRRRLHF